MASRSPARILLLAVACTAHACEREPASVSDEHADARTQPQPLYEGRDSDVVLPPWDTDLPTIAGIQYLEVVTGNVDPEAPLPMIIVIHDDGLYPRAMQHLLLTDISTGAAAYNLPARWVFVGAPGGSGPGYWLATKNWRSAWSPGLLPFEIEDRALNDAIAARAAELAVAIAALVELRPTTGRPFVTGFSEGGTLTWALAVTHGELFAAAFPIAGDLPRALWPESSGREIPKLIAIHGRADAVIEHEQVQATAAHLLELGYPVELRTQPDLGHELEPMLAEIRELLAEQVGAAAI